MSSLQAFALGLGTTLVTLATVQVIAYPVGRTLQAALRPRIKVTPLNVRATCVEYHRKSQEQGQEQSRCKDCDGYGHIKCSSCQGMGRCNRTDMAILPHGEWPMWCRNCSGSGESYCFSCMGTGTQKGPLGFRID